MFLKLYKITLIIIEVGTIKVAPKKTRGLIEEEQESKQTSQTLFNFLFYPSILLLNPYQHLTKSPGYTTATPTTVFFLSVALSMTV